jgi:DNA-binding MarR family transcriptional regulator
MRTTSRQRDQARTIRRAATALAARARAERGGTLSLNQVAVLGRIVVHGPITPGEVAAQLRMLPQSLTRTFAALEAAGYVRRMSDPDDGRQALLIATADGRSAINAEMAPRDRWLSRAMAALLTEDERALLTRSAELMARLAEFESDVALAEL